MKKITSFTIDHLKLLPWIYVSRKDLVGENIITTFDIRITKPNSKPVMNTAEIHTIEHLSATFLRNHNKFWEKIIYFWPMWCRTGFYLLLNWNFESKDIVELLKEMFGFIIKYEWEIPWAKAIECWNYLDMNLKMAKYLSKNFLEKILNNIKESNLIYPN